MAVFPYLPSVHFLDSDSATEYIMKLSVQHTTRLSDYLCEGERLYGRHRLLGDSIAYVICRDKGGGEGSRSQRLQWGDLSSPYHDEVFNPQVIGGKLCYLATDDGRWRLYWEDWVSPDYPSMLGQVQDIDGRPFWIGFLDPEPGDFEEVFENNPYKVQVGWGTLIRPPALSLWIYDRDRFRRLQTSKLSGLWGPTAHFESAIADKPAFIENVKIDSDGVGDSIVCHGEQAWGPHPYVDGLHTYAVGTTLAFLRGASKDSEVLQYGDEVMEWPFDRNEWPNGGAVRFHDGQLQMLVQSDDDEELHVVSITRD